MEQTQTHTESYGFPDQWNKLKLIQYPTTLPVNETNRSSK